MNATDTIILGVASGIMTTVVLYLLGRLLTGVVIPWLYGQLFYRGVDLTDEWETTTSTGSDSTQTLVVSIKQKGHRIHGQLQKISSVAGKIEDTKILDIKGEIKDRLIIASLAAKTRKQVTAACMALEVKGDGSVMTGILAGYDAKEADIRHTEVEFRRKPK